MTAAPHSPLVERAIDAAAKEMPTGIGESISPVHVFRAVKAALDACHMDEVRQVLEILVYAKDMKERSGDTPAYRAKKDEGWSRARALLAKLEGRL